MIDATQLPRVPSKLVAVSGSPVGEASGTVIARVDQAPVPAGDTTYIQCYPAKNLALVDGRYRPVAVEK